MIKKLILGAFMLSSVVVHSLTKEDVEKQYHTIKILNSKAEKQLEQLKSKSILHYDKLIAHYDYLTKLTKESTVNLSARYPDFNLHKKRYDYLVKTMPLIKKENDNTKKKIDSLTKENKHLQSVLKKLMAYANGQMDHYTLSIGDAETFDVDHIRKFYATYYSKGEYIPQRIYLNGSYKVKINRILVNGEYLSEVQK